MRTGAKRADADAGAVLRVLRSALLAAATLGVAVWAHRSANGNLPGAAGLVVIWLGATAAVAPFLGRPASYRRVLALVLFGQFGLHLVLSIAAGHGPRPAPTAASLYYTEHSMLAEPAPGASAAVGHADESDQRIGRPAGGADQCRRPHDDGRPCRGVGRVGALAGDR